MVMTAKSKIEKRADDAAEMGRKEFWIEFRQRNLLKPKVLEVE
jgi:hypothetical protein